MEYKVGQTPPSDTKQNNKQPRVPALPEDTSTAVQEIDLLVYKLYGLTEEEIRIVEGKK